MRTRVPCKVVCPTKSLLYRFPFRCRVELIQQTNLTKQWAPEWPVSCNSLDKISSYQVSRIECVRNFSRFPHYRRVPGIFTRLAPWTIDLELVMFCTVQRNYWIRGTITHGSTHDTTGCSEQMVLVTRVAVVSRRVERELITQQPPSQWGGRSAYASQSQCCILVTWFAQANHRRL